MKIAIIDYGCGNILSLLYSLERIGYSATVSGEPEVIRAADKVILPGVGHAGAAMKRLVEIGLAEVINQLQQPVLGICLGMQLLCRSTEEGNVKCLGIFDVDVIRFKPSSTAKVPHMGWNEVEAAGSGLFRNIGSSAWCYFVHSYYAPVCDETAAVTSYVHPFSSALKNNNFYGVQFHPEKSGATGAAILTNFINL